MSPENPVPGNQSDQKFKPYVPEDMEMREFTWRAILLGLAMTVVLGAANATSACGQESRLAPLIGRRHCDGRHARLEGIAAGRENIARTSGSIGEGIAAGAIFTIPAVLDRQSLAFL